MNNDQLYFYNRGFNDCLAKFLDTPPAKTLTDEEIIETVKNHFIGAIKLGIVLTNDNILDFARAILRKAQEK